MHLVLSLCLFGFAYFMGDWRNWQKYILTIQYVIISNLLYNYFCHDYLLWHYKGDILPNKHSIVDLAYTFVNLPAITLLFLSHYPYLNTKLKQAKYILFWVIGSFLVEFPFVHFKRLILKNGYEYWMDIFFYIVMYVMIRLNHTRPIKSYLFSVVIILFMLWFFKVPIK
ncbi:CBO0543 family protein [Fredinandcohnia sp. 179-A 10B2 NHS]|uniref:CBO0543 family protein n=1 Tax=Fredinandcohnia sp. 179-A 10B2 NHS TaxID=3235176 RepID=UPI00399F00A9